MMGYRWWRWFILHNWYMYGKFLCGSVHHESKTHEWVPCNFFIEGPTFMCLESIRTGAGKFFSVSFSLYWFFHGGTHILVSSLTCNVHIRLLLSQCSLLLLSLRLLSLVITYLRSFYVHHCILPNLWLYGIGVVGILSFLGLRRLCLSLQFKDAVSTVVHI